MLITDTSKLLESQLNQILSWQSDLYDCNEEFECVLLQFTKEDGTLENHNYILRLEHVKVVFQETINYLYINLGLLKQYPTLASVDADFVKTFLLCRDKKIDLHKAATSVLNEMLNLDDAAWGSHNPLGDISFLNSSFTSGHSIGHHSPIARNPYASDSAQGDQNTSARG
jgi:hypothetical protein